MGEITGRSRLCGDSVRQMLRLIFTCKRLARRVPRMAGTNIHALITSARTVVECAYARALTTD